MDKLPDAWKPMVEEAANGISEQLFDHFSKGHIIVLAEAALLAFFTEAEKQGLVSEMSLRLFSLEHGETDAQGLCISITPFPPRNEA